MVVIVLVLVLVEVLELVDVEVLDVLVVLTGHQLHMTGHNILANGDHGSSVTLLGLYGSPHE